MLILISPAKTLDYQSPLATQRYTQPVLLDHSQQLIDVARQLSAPQIKTLMGISDKLADLNAVCRPRPSARTTLPSPSSTCGCSQVSTACCVPLT